MQVKNLKAVSKGTPGRSPGREGQPVACISSLGGLCLLAAWLRRAGSVSSAKHISAE